MVEESERESASRSRRTWPQRLVLIFGVLAVMGCLGGSFGVAYFGYKYDKVTKYGLALPAADPGGPTNFLVVGSDSRAAVAKNDPNSGAFLDGTASGKRSDTILIVRVDPRTRTATMLSLPRDLWVPIAGTHEMQRINAAYGLGQQVLADTIQQYLGIPINHYVEIDFRGFQGLVNAIGGVPMYFERAMRDANSGLDVEHPGCVTLDGSQALAFARSRHLQYILHGVWQTDPTGDLGRITRQQLFVKRAISRAVSKGLTNPVTLDNLVNIGVSNVGIDGGLSPKDLVSLGRRFATFPASQLATYTVPVTPFTTPAGADVLQLDSLASVPTLDLFRTQKGFVPGGGAGASSEASVPIEVLNGSGLDKRAANVAGALEGAGFTISSTGDASLIGPETVARTEIRYADGDQLAALQLQSHLMAGATLVEDSAVPSGTLLLVVGTDFTKVSASVVPSRPRRPRRPATIAATTTAPSHHDDAADRAHARLASARRQLWLTCGSGDPAADGLTVGSGQGRTGSALGAIRTPAHGSGGRCSIP